MTTDDEKKIVGRSIRLARINKGLSISKLAGLLGVSYTTVSRWENGHNLPSGTCLPSLSSHLGLPISSLNPDFLPDLVSEDARRHDSPAPGPAPSSNSETLKSTIKRIVHLELLDQVDTVFKRLDPHLSALTNHILRMKEYHAAHGQIANQVSDMLHLLTAANHLPHNTCPDKQQKTQP